MAVGLERESSENTEALRDELVSKVARFDTNKNRMPL